MAVVDRRYEAKHLETMKTGLARLNRTLKVNADMVAREIASLQSKQLIDPLKYGTQLKRNKKLQKAIAENFFALEENLGKELNGQTAEQWGLANKKNTILANNYITGDVPAQYTRLNLDALNQFQKRFEGGKNLSQRVHNLTELNKQLYEDYIGSGITQGKSAASISRELTQINENPYNVKVFDKDGNPTVMRKISTVLQPNAKGRGIYRSAQKNLYRLARTETNSAYRTSDWTRIQQLDFVVGYEVHLSGSHNVDDMCDFLAGKYPKTFKFTGWHPACICYVTTILKTKKEFREGLASKNAITKIPNSAQRYQKTAKKKQYFDWQKSNFKADGTPYARLGGATEGIEPYKISVDAKDYKPKKKILKSASNNVY